jgi:hypothetical protein
MTICDRLADGESLRAICADAGMPDSRWSARTDPLVDQDQLDNFLEEILEIWQSGLGCGSRAHRPLPPQDQGPRKDRSPESA